MSRDATSQVDEAIWKGIKGRTESDPVDLADIIFAVDFYERIVLGHDELVGDFPGSCSAE